MTRKRIIRNVGFAAAALCLPLFVGSAFADRGDRKRDHPRASYDHDRNHDRGKGYRRQHNRPKVGFEFNVSFGDRHRDRGRYRHRSSRDRHVCGHSCRRGCSYRSSGYRGHGSAYVVRNNRCDGGYWKRQWCPPVYRTYYDDCGRRIRKCVKAGYWKRVYVRY